jgi:hypothetical protein
MDLAAINYTDVRDFKDIQGLGSSTYTTELPGGGQDTMQTTTVTWVGHGLEVGDVVRFKDIAAAGWKDLSDAYAVFEVVDDNSFLIQVDSSSFAPYNPGTDDGQIGYTTTLLMFGPTVHERLDMYMGLSGDHHVAFGEDTDVTLSDGSEADLVLYPGALGALRENAEFDKNVFEVYFNAQMMCKLLLLQETIPTVMWPSLDAPVPAPKTLSSLLSDLLTAKATADARKQDPNAPEADRVWYDFERLVLNGDHGGNIMTATMQQVYDAFGVEASSLPYGLPVYGDLWLTSIDGDHTWRQDSQNAQSQFFQYHRIGEEGEYVEWQIRGLPEGDYVVQVDWMDNLPLRDQGKFKPSSRAEYVVNGTDSYYVNQRLFPLEVDGLDSWLTLDDHLTVGPDAILTVRLLTHADNAKEDDYVIAGRVSIYPIGSPAERMTITNLHTDWTDLTPDVEAISDWPKRSS